jgi:metal-dependent amidase/aminoacylase/carboxypeptidase family protein
MRSTIRAAVFSLVAALYICAPVFAQNDLDQRINKEADSLLATYKHLHEHPELSTQEKETSALIAADLKNSGYEVTDHFGQYAESALAAYDVRGDGPARKIIAATACTGKLGQV